MDGLAIDNAQIELEKNELPKERCQAVSTLDRLILGTTQLGLSYGINNQVGLQSESNRLELLKYAYDCGIKKLDTAQAYGSSEKILGLFHKAYKNCKFEILTKFRISSNPIKQTCLTSLAELGVESLECYSIHDYSVQRQNHLKIRETFKILDELKQQNLIKNIGVSIYSNQEFEEVIQSNEVDIIQIPYNLLDNNSQRMSLIKQAKLNHKKIHVRSVFLQGLFFIENKSITNSLAPLTTYLDQIKSIAQEHNYNIMELAMLYPLSNPYIDGIVLGVDNLAQLKLNISVFSANQVLAPAILNKIDSIVIDQPNLLNPGNWI